MPVKSSTVVESGKPPNKFLMEQMTAMKKEAPLEIDRTLSSLILGDKTKHSEEDCFTLDLFEGTSSKISDATSQ